MASWLVGRLVSGLGVATKAAAHPLVRQASCDAAPGHVARLAASECGRWPDADQGVRWAFPGAATLSSCSSPPAAELPASASGSLSPVLPLTFLRLPFPSSTAASRVGPTTAAAITGGNSGSATAFYSSSAAAAAVATANAAAASGSVAAAAGAAGGGGGSAGEDAGAAPLPAFKPDLVEKFLSLDVSSSSVRRRAERQQVLRDFQSHPADTGTPPVMVALWTHRVRSLVRVFDSGRKQLPSIRQLEMLVNRRRRMLTWLRRTDFESYSYTIAKLGLRDIYVPAGGEHRYREGVRHSEPVDDDINRLRFNFHTKYRKGKTSLWKRLRPLLVAEDPALQSADADAAVEDRQRRQQRREVAAQQRLAAEREREGKQGR
ncbi:hypothetical protein PLESTB_001035700 [Pleodorina starrii]|uniref:Small ribosomal subunit protein uS15c n=1 Tax=Pleodorina starrii TaxID=330485 RepID=A0A9W6BQR2_9CHLO|nr:hypothetical protein PLESTB_001035700 [Pleodorina starrii]GLC63838.1 hypothetical protein PLESTF_000088400 [Pleodorina starrii]